MKKFVKFLITTHLFCAGAPALASAVEAKMSAFKMNVCSSEKECLEVEALASEGSQVRPLHRLVKPQVTLIRNKKSNVLQADTGYVDLSENQLVLYKKEADVMREISFNLTTLKRLDVLHGAR